MTEIFINDMPVVPKSDSTIKLTLANQVISGASTYTLDVTLPLDIPQNIAVFGFINRRDVLADKATLPARVVSDNCELLIGEAVVNRIDNDAVTVQLMGHASAFNYKNKMKDVYIDTLDLGDWYTIAYGFYPGMAKTGTAWRLAQESKPVMQPPSFDEEYNTWVNTFLRGYGSQPFVTLPIIEQNTGTVCNELVIRAWETAGKARLDYPYSTPDGQHNGWPQVKVAVQPFIWFMAELIAKATGLTLSRADNGLYTDTDLKRVFIASTDIRIEAAKCLPHWTVSEWWDNIANAFGLSVIFDDATKHIKITSRADYYNNAAADMIEIRDVVDAFQVEVDSTELTDISDSEVSFESFDGGSAFDRIPEDLEGLLYEQRYTGTLADLQSALDAGSLDVYTLYIMPDTRRFIVLDGQLREVDQLRKREAVADEAGKPGSITLKFVPCPVTAGEVSVCVWPSEKSGDLYDEYHFNDGDPTGRLHLKALMMTRPGSELCDWSNDENNLISSEKLDIGQTLKDIDDGEFDSPEEESTDDVCYIAAYPERTSTLSQSVFFDRNQIGQTTDIRGLHFSLEFPRPWTFGKAPTVQSRPALDLTVSPAGGTRRMAMIGSGSSINRIHVRQRYCIQFISQSIPNPASLFLIDNIKYVCDKLEVSLNDRERSPLITGYFYKAD